MLSDGSSRDLYVLSRIVEQKNEELTPIKRNHRVCEMPDHNCCKEERKRKSKT